VQLFESFEDAFHLSINLWPFDKGECNRDVPDWGLEAGYPLVGHHVDSEFPDKGVCASSVAVKE